MTDGSHWHDFSPTASEEAARFAHALAGELPGALRILADAGDIEALKLLLSRLASHTMRPVQIEIDGPAVHLSIWRALAARHTGVPVSVSRVNLREARASSEQRAAITVVLASLARRLVRQATALKSLGPRVVVEIPEDGSILLRQALARGDIDRLLDRQAIAALIGSDLEAPFITRSAPRAAALEAQLGSAWTRITRAGPVNPLRIPSVASPRPASE
jgi:hypothetical protein